MRTNRADNPPIKQALHPIPHTRTPTPRPPRSNPRSGAALIITLLVVSVLTVIVIGFLASMSTERLTADSHAALTQAELAAKAGVNDFRALLASETLPNPFYLIGQRDTASGVAPLPVLGIRDLESQDQLLPLVSADLSSFKQQRQTDPDALSTFINGLVADRADPDKTTNMNFPTASGRNAINNSTTAPEYLSQWKYLRDDSGNNFARYAYFIVDEQSKVNLSVASGTDTSPRSADVVDGSDVVVSSARNGYLNEQEHARLETLRESNSISLENFGQIFDTRERADASREWMTTLIRPEPDLIPAGYLDNDGKFIPYPDAGKPKFNINELATDTSHGANAQQRATNIAEIIDRNLPDFQKRDASFGTSGDIRYIRRVAASIVDYIDTDSITTLLPDGEPAGMELQGVVAAIIEEYVYRGASETEDGQWLVSIDHSVFVELWNPYTMPTSGTFRLALESLREVEIPGGIIGPLPLFDRSVPVSLGPNEFKVFDLGMQNATFPTPVKPEEGPTMPQTSSRDNRTPHSRFKAFWNGGLANWTPNDSSLFSERGPGLVKGALPPMIIGDSNWAGNLSQHNLITGKGYRSVADPRQNYIQNYTWSDRTPTSSSFLLNGRSNYSITGNSSGQDFRAMWIGRDFLPRSPVLGRAMGGLRPNLVSSPYSSSEESGAPGVIANQDMKSIGELGNIYDPANVNEIGLAARGGNPSAWSVSGGGRTLRLGQPEREFRNDGISPSGSERMAPDWNTPGLGANHLLDLFTVKPPDTAGTPSGFPRLNVNTANREALAALFWNLRATGDPIVTKATITRELAEGIAEGIIAERPYSNYAALESIMDRLVDPVNYKPTLGVTTFNYPSYLGGTRDVDTALVADRTVEGGFRRLVENLGVTSKHLRLIVVGQALSPQGAVGAQTRIEMIFELNAQPFPAPDGTLTFKLIPTEMNARRL